VNVLVEPALRRLPARALANAEIAGELFLSEATRQS
jgi:hypothetical protein